MTLRRARRSAAWPHRWASRRRCTRGARATMLNELSAGSLNCMFQALPRRTTRDAAGEPPVERRLGEGGDTAAGRRASSSRLLSVDNGRQSAGQVRLVRQGLPPSHTGGRSGRAKRGKPRRPQKRGIDTDPSCPPTGAAYTTPGPGPPPRLLSEQWQGASRRPCTRRCGRSLAARGGYGVHRRISGWRPHQRGAGGGGSAGPGGSRRRGR